MKRLRPAWSEEELHRIYTQPHDHRRWRGHHLRVDVTSAVGVWMTDGGVSSAADLSCGNGAVLKRIPADQKFFGDFAKGYAYTGPIEETVQQIPSVDLFVCCETLEHLDDPLLALRKIREKTSMLLLSTPVDNWKDPNEEHYWAWSKGDVTKLLRKAGFTPWVYTAADMRPHEGPYCYGIWGCK